MFETAYEQSTHEAERIIQLGVTAKRHGKFEEAKRLYESAANIAPWYLHVYYALGKINYLLELQNEALLNYSIAAHLQLGLGPSMELNQGGLVLKQLIASHYPQSLIDEVRSIHPYADLLLIDENTPRHLGHALIDLLPEEILSPEIKASAHAYKETIMGSHGLYIQMDAELEQNLYSPIGFAYLLQHLQWDKIGKHPAEDVHNL